MVPRISNYILGFLLIIALLYANLAFAALYNDSRIKVGVEGYNVFDRLLVGVYTQVKFDYDDVNNRFWDVDVDSWRYKAWWCFTCYAEITSTSTQVDPNYRLYGKASWNIGSWNVQFTGYNQIEVEREIWMDDDWIEIDYRVFIDGQGTYGDIIEDLAPNLLPVIINLLLKYR